jgi:hypothetical protein
MKVAIVVAPARYWRWQRLLADRLGARHAVSVFDGGDARGLPAMLRALLAVERRVFKAPADVALEVAPVAEMGALQSFDLVIDLSGGAARPGALRLLFDGEADEQFLWGRLLRKQLPLISVQRDGVPLAASLAAIEDQLVFARGLRFAFSRASHLIERAVEIVAGERQIAPMPEPAHGSPVAYSFGALLGFAWARGVAILQSFVRKRGYWIIAWRRKDGDYVNADARGRFIADPFLVSHEGRAFMFAEVIEREGAKGHIVVAPLPERAGALQFEDALIEPHHLSYPFVFEHDGEMFMMPEGGASGKLSIYRASSFPTGWTHDRDVMKARAFDATIIERDGRFWLFCTIASSGSTWDELSIFHGPSMFGPWTPHTLNPVKSDARGARMGGRFRIVGDHLLRPAQDCSAGYGAKLAWYEVTTLTPDAFAERRLEDWAPDAFGAFTGIHTYDALGDVEVVDLKMDRPRRGAPAPRFSIGHKMKVPDAH